MNSFLKNVVEFIDVLRLAGVRISISESIDAVNALQYVNTLNRSEVRTALSVCLAKSEIERRLFFEAFDQFFILPDVKGERIASKLEQLEQKKQEVIENASELRFQDEQLEIADELKEVYAALPEDEKQSIRNFLEKTSTGKNVRTAFKSIVETMIQGKLSSLKNKYADTLELKPGILQAVFSEAGIIADDVAEAVRQEDALLHKKLVDLSDEDIPKAIQLIKHITEKLRKNVIRRYSASKKKARLDFKKTLRSNLSAGGILFRLKYKRKPMRKQKILILCDVSSSMYRFSGFVLQFIAGIQRGTASADSYIFSEDIEHLNMHEFVNAMDYEQKVMQSRVWRKGTDIHRAIRYILHESHAVLNSSTIVILVSDAKTLNGDKAAESLKLLEAKVKRILWLNPVQESEWPGIAGIERFKEYSTMMDCSTIERLGKACAML